MDFLVKVRQHYFMEIRTILKSEKFEWIDIVDPNKSDLEQIGQKFGLHSTSVQDCLDPDHLPKFEKIDNVDFLIFRAYDDSCSVKSGSVQELTRKIAVFHGANFLLTVHRKDQPFLTRLMDEWKNSTIADSSLPVKIICDLVNGVLNSYQNPINVSFAELESLEMGAFLVPGSKPFKLKSAYYLKRSSFVFKMLMRLTSDVVDKLTVSLGFSDPRFQDLRETSDKLNYYANELVENITTLIGLHISVSTQKTTEASYKTGEIIRVLTILSFFLLPLNVITGIYGMNFENMPETKLEHGYAIALSMMILVILSIYFWLKKKGWLKL